MSGRQLGDLTVMRALEMIMPFSREAFFPGTTKADWEPWPDFDAQLARRTRRAFLEQHCETDTLVCTAHFPLPSAGRVVRAGEAFRIVNDDGNW